MFYICVLNIFKSRLDETEDIIFVFVSAKSQVYSMNVRLAKMSLHFIQQFVPVIEADSRSIVQNSTLAASLI